MTTEVADEEILLRRVGAPVGKIGQWKKISGRWTVPLNVWEGKGLDDQPSVYRQSLVQIDLMLSNCGTSTSPTDNGCFGIAAKAVREIDSLFQRDGGGRELPGSPYVVQVTQQDSACEGHAHAVIATSPGLTAATPSRRQLRQNLYNALSLIAESYINDQAGGAGRGGWMVVPPGLAAL